MAEQTPPNGDEPKRNFPSGFNQKKITFPGADLGASLASSCRKWAVFWSYPFYRYAVYLFILFLLFIIPFKPGPINGTQAPNAAIPLIGQMEIVCNQQNAKLLKKATASYLATKAVTKTVAVIQDMQLNIGPVSLAPGSFLSGTIASIDRVADGLFLIMTVMLVEKCALGVIAWLCFKILFPCALILWMIYDYKHNQVSRILSSFLFKLGVLLLLFFPTLSYLTTKIDNGFAPMINNTLKEVEESANSADALAEIEKAPAENKTLSEKFSAIKERLAHAIDQFTPTSIVEKANELLKSAEALTDKLFNLFAAFALSVFIVPLGIIAIYWKIFKLLGAGSINRNREAEDKGKEEQVALER